MRLPLVSCLSLLASCVRVVAAVEPVDWFRLDAPSATIERSGTVVQAGEGFVFSVPAGASATALHDLAWLATNGLLLSGDALRWNRPDQQLFALGSIHLVSGPLHLQADRIGIDFATRRADAWDVRIAIRRDDGLLAYLSAERASLLDDVITLSRLRGHTGHGALFGLSATEVRIRLQPSGTVNDFRQGAPRHIKDITVLHPVGRIGGVPVAWLPAIYRDFQLRYPWTHYAFGSSSRLGPWVRFRMGSGLPAIGGWSSWLGARIDYHDLAGTGYGAEARWRHEHDLGHGRLFVHQMPGERLYRAHGDTFIEEQQRDYLDVRHYARAEGFALRLAYVAEPTPDTDTGTADNRWRNDYYHDVLRHDPLARQGAEIAWSGPYGSLRASYESPGEETRPESERRPGVHGRLHTLHLFGPFSFSADAHAEDLQRDTQAAVRYRGAARLIASQWWGAFQWYNEAGLRGLSYDEVTRNGQAEDARSAWLPYAESGLALQMIGAPIAGSVHRLKPSVGFRWSDLQHGDVLPALDFGDQADTLNADQRSFFTELESNFAASGQSLALDLAADWALRDRDRHYRDASGTVQIADDRLIEARATCEGSFSDLVTLRATLVYDGLRNEVRQRTASLLIDTERWELGLDAREERQDDAIDAFYQPHLRWQPGRYAFQAEAALRNGGRALDEWTLGLTRHMVDGRLTLRYGRLYDAAGNFEDESWTLRFELDAFGN